MMKHKTTITIFFILLLSLTGITTAIRVSLPLSYSLDDILTGVATTEIEHALTQQIPFKEIVTQAWARANFALFNEGKSGVIVGQNGWLFSREEYFWPYSAENNINANLQFVQHIQQQLSAIDMQLAVILLPEKVSIYAEYAAISSPLSQNNLYEQVAQTLTESSIQVISGKEALTKPLSQQQTFLKTDTHWTPFGAQSVANEAAKRLPSWHGDQVFTTELSQTESVLGDLLNFIPAGDKWLKTRFTPDEININVTSLAAAEFDSLFDDAAPISTALVGTSYSADARWNFHGYLQQALELEIINYAKSGDGPFTPMHNLINTNELQAQGITHILWEIPVRYFIQELPTAISVESDYEKL
ncbi:alginate O-acetyltransferase AlgX-related protein [Alteromonas facilis]|uniref:alginate O-acetyltransferase AlgX-related protein n=1 Tax=Alteromonas facilis TaxID=2048004 RepID=UPI000C292065|nr:hypothetical protein [Alteromonas facilis]